MAGTLSGARKAGLVSMALHEDVGVAKQLQGRTVSGGETVSKTDIPICNVIRM
jgi:hypothetical protein